MDIITYLNRQRGAQFIEFALVFPLLLFLTMISIDLYRYFAASMALDHAAHQALDVFRKNPIAKINSAAHCSVDLTDCTSYLNALNEAEQEALRYVSNRISAYGSDSKLTLKTYRYFDSGDHHPLNLPYTSLSNRESAIGLLRPGEAVYEKNQNGIESKLFHTIRPDYHTGSVSPALAPFANSFGWPHIQTITWDDALREYPIIAHMSAEFTLYSVPFLGPYTIRATHLAYKNTSKQSLMRRKTDGTIEPVVGPGGGPPPAGGIAPPPVLGAAPPGACGVDECLGNMCYCTFYPSSDFCLFCPTTNCAIDCG